MFWGGDKKAHYIHHGGVIAKRGLAGIGFCGLLLMLLVMSGAMGSPGAQGSPVVLSAGLGIALLLPTGKVVLDITRSATRDYGLYSALVGASLLFTPIYLLTLFGEQPNIVMDLVFVGVALILASVFWPPPKRES